MRKASALLKRPVQTRRSSRRFCATNVLKKDILASQWLSEDEIRSIQLVRLKKLLRHAYETTVYYHELFDEIGLCVEEIRSLADYAACVPVLTKRPLQQRMEDFLSSEWQDRVKISATSGSTGRPTRYAHPHPFPAHTAMWELVNDLCGLQGGERKLHLQGRPLPNGHEHIYDPRDNVHRYSFYQMSPTMLREVVDHVVEWQPELVLGYTSLIVLVAHRLQKRGHSGLGVKAIQTHSEKLHPAQRELVEQVYGGPAFEHYGSGEIYHFGVECQAHAGIHLFSPLRIFELEPLNDQQPDTGELIVTDLYNYAMPFLRYRIGDVVTIDRRPCACGRSLPRVEIDGRTWDLIRLRDGTILGPIFFRELMDPRRVERFLVHQRSYERVDVHIVPNELFTDDFREHLLGEIRAKLRIADTRIILDREIDDELAGKLRVIRSDVSEQIVRVARELPTRVH